MTPAEIYQVARNAGFPPDTAVKMTAIALRESSGVPTAYNGKGPDNSYGLWQVNMIGSLGAARRAQFGITDNSQLFDPATNAAAAYAIWNGNDANLDAAWYIDRPGYAEKYQSFLPAAEQAAVDAGDFLQDGTVPDEWGVTAWLADTSTEMKVAIAIGAATVLGYVWNR